MTRRAALATLVLLAACTRGMVETPAAAPDAGARVAAARAGLSEAWREGKLPEGLEAGTPVPGGTITIRMNLEPGHLMYLIEPDWWLSRIVNHNLNESLVRPDPRDHPRYQIVPELAESWEESADHLTHTFRLRKGVTWHDGKPFTSADVKFTYERILDPAVRAASLRHSFQDLESVTAPDPHTVVFKWKKPYVFAMRQFGDIPIYPAHAFAGHEGAKFNEAPFKRAPIGTGPYKFESWVEKSAITLARNDAYWGKKGHVDKLVYRPVPEPNVGQQLLLRGEVDSDMVLTSEQYVEAEKEPLLVDAYHRLKIWESNFAWIGFNMKRPFFEDVRVRKALIKLFDREKMRQTLQRGVPANANCVFYHLGPNCDPATKQVEFDPAGAVADLAAAGWKDTDGDGLLDKGGKPFRFTALYPAGNPVNEQHMLAWKDQLKRAGIELELNKIEWAVFTGKLRSHEFDVCMLAWVGAVENDPTQIWHSSQTEDGSNYVHYASPKADALIEQIRGEFDETKRQALFRALNAQIVEDAPYLLLYHMPKRTLLHRRLRGVYESPIESPQYREMWVDPAWKPKAG